MAQCGPLGDPPGSARQGDTMWACALSSSVTKETGIEHMGSWGDARQVQATGQSPWDGSFCQAAQAPAGACLCLRREYLVSAEKDSPPSDACCAAAARQLTLLGLRPAD